MAKCVSCSETLTGRQRKFCSRRCKNAQGNKKLQCYRAQQSRGRKRKLRLIELSGNCCTKCGYRRNFSALEFHHVCPSDKSFTLDLRSLSNRRWEVILSEADKCVLVCSNCHKEIHNPDCLLPEKSRFAADILHPLKVSKQSVTRINAFYKSMTYNFFSRATQPTKRTWMGVFDQLYDGSPRQQEQRI